MSPPSLRPGLRESYFRVHSLVVNDRKRELYGQKLVLVHFRLRDIRLRLCNEEKRILESRDDRLEPHLLAVGQRLVRGNQSSPFCLCFRCQIDSYGNVTRCICTSGDCLRYQVSHRRAVNRLVLQCDTADCVNSGQLTECSRFLPSGRLNAISESYRLLSQGFLSLLLHHYSAAQRTFLPYPLRIYRPIAEPLGKIIFFCISTKGSLPTRCR